MACDLVRNMVRGPFILELEDTSFEKAAAALSTDPGFVLIDAGSAPARSARYSIIASRPKSTFLMSGGFITVDGHTTIDSPREALSRFCSKVSGLEADPYLPFSCGLIGYIGFEAARALKGLEPAPGFSRHPQSMMGLYDAVAIFDRAEGTARIVANDEDRTSARRSAYILHDRMAGAKAPAEAPPAPAYYGAVKTTPDEAHFRMTVEAARSWIRSDLIRSIHLVRHAHVPLSNASPLAAFMGAGHAPGIKAFMTHEGAGYAFFSTDSLVSITGKDLRSTVALSHPSAKRTKAALYALRDEISGSLAALCEQGSMTEVDGVGRENSMSFTGALRRGLAPIDAVVGMIPSHMACGTPYGRVLEFIGQNEKVHRTFYGGAFGTIDPLRCDFRTIERATTYADGTAGTTMGIDMDEGSDAEEISGRLAGIVQCI